jgi:cysteine desulfurase
MPQRHRSAPQVEGIYLDYQGSTPLDPAVVEAMLPWWQHHVGNPYSGEHTFGSRAAEAIENARTQIAGLLSVEGNSILFTSSGTESNNLAILGTARGDTGGRRKILVSAIEHTSVLAPAKVLESEGFQCVVLPVDSNGYVVREAFLDALGADVSLVSVGAVNKEIGTIEDIQWVTERCHEFGALLHSDAAQALTAESLPLSTWGVDLASVSAHKAYGPQGIGALYLAPASIQRLHALQFGGNQERGLRPGTLPTALCIGFGVACEILRSNGQIERSRVRQLQVLLISSLLRSIPGAQLNGPDGQRHPGNVNVLIDGIDARELVERLQPTVALVSGSDFHTGAHVPSHVLRAIGLSTEDAHASVRMSIGRYTTEEEIRKAVAYMASEVERMRESRKRIGE